MKGGAWTLICMRLVPFWLLTCYQSYMSWLSSQWEAAESMLEWKWCRFCEIDTTCSYSWLDSDTIIANVIPEGRGPPPIRPLAPIGPRIEDNSLGKQSQARTYQDLLKDGHDEDLFDYYCTSELLYIKVHSCHDLVPVLIYICLVF